MSKIRLAEVWFNWEVCEKCGHADPDGECELIRTRGTDFLEIDLVFEEILCTEFKEKKDAP
ncbi:MAG: hypothetical protein ABFE07_29430 [Armatimonadia bacterium]